MSIKKPNIVWFITDDTGFNMLHYTGGNVLTPNIDRIASDGVTCSEYHTAAPACTPSRFSYLTGQYPSSCSSPDFSKNMLEHEPYKPQFNAHMADDSPSIARVFQRAGYATAFTGKWHASGFARSQFNIDDDPRDPQVKAKLTRDYQGMQQIIRSTGFDTVEAVAWGNTDHRPIESLRYHNIEWSTQAALEFLDQQEGSDAPFFLNFATTTIHGPHHVASIEGDPTVTENGLLDKAPDVQAPRKTIRTRLEAAGIEVDHRSAGALWTDDAFGAVMQKVEEMGLAENTICVFSTDHGIGVDGGKFSCYQGGVHIPHCMMWKGNIAPGSQCAELLQNTDFLPTMADMAGVEIPAEDRIDGRSYWPALRDKSDHSEDLYFEWGITRAVRTKKLKKCKGENSRRLGII